MHDGSIATLRDVIDLYDAGGGPRAGKDPRLVPLGLSEEEKRDLVEFLGALSSPSTPFTPPEVPAYRIRPLGEN